MMDDEYEVAWNYGHGWNHIGRRTAKQLEQEIIQRILGNVHSLWKAAPRLWVVLNRRNGRIVRSYRLYCIDWGKVSDGG